MKKVFLLLAVVIASISVALTTPGASTAQATSCLGGVYLAGAAATTSFAIGKKESVTLDLATQTYHNGVMEAYQSIQNGSNPEYYIGLRHDSSGVRTYIQKAGTILQSHTASANVNYVVSMTRTNTNSYTLSDNNGDSMAFDIGSGTTVFRFPAYNSSVTTCNSFTFIFSSENVFNFWNQPPWGFVSDPPYVVLNTTPSGFEVQGG